MAFLGLVSHSCLTLYRSAQFDVNILSLTTHEHLAVVSSAPRDMVALLFVSCGIDIVLDELMRLF